MSRILASLALVTLFSCKKKVEVAVRPEPVPAAPSVSSSASVVASASASASSAPITHCTLDAPLGDGHKQTGEWSIDWKTETGGANDLERPVLHLDHESAHLSVSLENKEEVAGGRHGVWPKRVAMASEGERLQAFLIGNERDGCQGFCEFEWATGTCTCNDMGSRDTPRPPRVMKMPGEPVLRVVTRSAGALEIKPFELKGDSQTGDPEVAAITLTSSGSVVVYRSVGAMWAAPLKSDGTVAEGVVASTLIDGGDMTAPAVVTGTVEGKERVFVLFGRRPKPKQPRELRVATFDPATHKATLPKPVQHAALGGASQPSIVRDGAGFALAWFESEPEANRAHLLYGRGATPAEAAAAAVEVGVIDGEGSEVSLATQDGLPRVRWVTTKTSGTSLIVCPK
jgi:hypothetical protein